MGRDWKEISLAAVMDVKHGFAFPGENIRDAPPGDILLTPGNFAIGGGFKGDKFKYFDGEVPDDYVLNEGDLVVTMTDLSKQADTLGFPALVPKPRGPRFLHNQRLGKVLIKRGAELDRGFLFYLLRTEEYRHEVLASSTGTTVKHTSPGRILAHKASIPPLAEQKAIAAVLGALDDKIELNRRMNATLEAMARALFQSWFVDFDPVRAKLDGRKPTALDESTAALFPTSFQDSPLGPIPRGWDITRLDELASVMMGLSPDGDSYNANGIGIPLINGPVEFGDYFPVKSKWTEAATRFAAEGDLIFCVRGSTTGRRVVSDGKYGIGRGVCAIRAKDGFHGFLYQTINVGLERLLEKTTGSVFPSLSAPDIKGFSVLKPSRGLLGAYPPDLQEAAVKTVLAQAELLCADWAA